MLVYWRVNGTLKRAMMSEDVTLDIDNLAEEALEPTWFYFYKARAMALGAPLGF